MDKLIAVVKREFLERVRTKWFLIATLTVPMLIVASMVLPAVLARRSQATAACGSSVKPGSFSDSQ